MDTTHDLLLGEPEDERRFYRPFALPLYSRKLPRADGHVGAPHGRVGHMIASNFIARYEKLGVFSLLQ